MIRHLACIMDGNRRWARKQTILPWYGHKEGVNTLKRVIDYCLARGISYLTLYAFSLENLQRPRYETRALFELIQSQASSIEQECVQKGARITFAGDRSAFPKTIFSVCEQLERTTRDGKRLRVSILFCYGGRQEIVNAVRRIVADIREGVVSENSIDVSTIEKYLWTGDIPSPDLIIRTGGFQRLSNFLLYQAAYSELYFTNCLWPDLTEQELDKACEYYQTCQRNFGV